MELKSSPEQAAVEVLTIGVEGQERRGQAALVQSHMLPADCSGRAALEAAGVVFGPPSEDDPLFMPAILPAGWSKVPHPEHHMYSLLLDEQGRCRAEIFYKAAFYDRRADMHAVRRFSITWPDDWRELGDVRRNVVRNAGAVVFDPGLDGDASELTCRAWLGEHWPEWEDPGAYW